MGASRPTRAERAQDGFHDLQPSNSQLLCLADASKARTTTAATTTTTNYHGHCQQPSPVPQTPLPPPITTGADSKKPP